MERRGGGEGCLHVLELACSHGVEKRNYDPVVEPGASGIA